jgi:CDGSH-type Zn-finger protein
VAGAAIGQVHWQTTSKETDMAGGQIKATENGPYVVENVERIIDADGNEYDVSGRSKVVLCRCGASTTKPFCDGTHSKLGFEAAERAVAERG